MAERKVRQLVVVEKVGLGLAPFFLASAFYVHLYVSNSDELLNAAELMWLYWMSNAIIAVVLLLLLAVLRGWAKAVITVSWAVLLFYSYGHFYDLIPFIRYRYLLALYGLSMVAVTIGVAWLSRKRCESVARYVNVFALMMLIIPLTHVVFKRQADIRSTFDSEILEPRLTTPPDIYYIILDEYARNDVLQRVYSYDNVGFYDFLDDRGFFVATESHANYPHTFLSLASSLNMKYLTELSEHPGVDSEDRTIPIELIRRSEVASILKANGYRYIELDSGWAPTSTSELCDERLTYVGMRESTVVLFNTTALRPFRSFINMAANSWRERHLFNFRMLEEQARHSSPKFVLAHFLLPHPPFVFGETGERTSPFELKVVDGGYAPATPEHQRRYLAQLKFTTTRVMQLVDTIIAHSTSKPIIIIQSDHGSYPAVPWEPSEEFVTERFPILNALLVDDALKKEYLYNTISPVNSFRAILKYYGETSIKLLDDHAYYSPLNDTPYAFVEVTDMLRPVVNSDALPTPTVNK